MSPVPLAPHEHMDNRNQLASCQLCSPAQASTLTLEGPVHGPVRKNEALYEVHGAPLGADHSLHHAEVLFRIAHVNGQNADVPDGQHHVVMLWRMLRAFKIALKMPDVLRTSRLRGSNLQDDSSRTQTCVNWHKSDRNQVHFILSAQAWHLNCRPGG